MLNTSAWPCLCSIYATWGPPFTRALYLSPQSNSESKIGIKDWGHVFVDLNPINWIILLNNTDWAPNKSDQFSCSSNNNKSPPTTTSLSPPTRTSSPPPPPTHHPSHLDHHQHHRASPYSPPPPGLVYPYRGRHQSGEQRDNDINKF